MPNAKIKGNRIGKRLKEARRRQGLDQVELSAMLSVDFDIELSQRVISEIELGRRAVRDKELYAMACALNVDPNWLFIWASDAV